MQGVVGRKSYTKAASISSIVSTRIEREPAERVREGIGEPQRAELLTRGGSSHWFEY